MRETISQRYDRLVNRVVGLLDTDPRAYWIFQEYSRDQDFRLPPGPGSKIMATQSDIMDEFFSVYDNLEAS